MIACLAVAGMAMSGCVTITSDLHVDAEHDTVTGTLHLESDEGQLNLIIVHDKNPKNKPYFPDAHTPQEVFEALLGQIPWLPPDRQVQHKTVQGTTRYYTDVTYNARPFAEFKDDDGMSFRHDGDTIRFRMSLDPAIYSSGMDTSTANKGVQALTIQITITLPGKVSSPDGEVSGSTVSWKIASNAKRPMELTAMSVVAPSPSPTASQGPTVSPTPSPPKKDDGIPLALLLVAAVVVAAAIFTLVLVLIWRGRGGKDKAETPAEPPTEY
jgi:hypothetical protein